MPPISAPQRSGVTTHPTFRGRINRLSGAEFLAVFAKRSMEEIQHAHVRKRPHPWLPRRHRPDEGEEVPRRQRHVREEADVRAGRYHLAHDRAMMSPPPWSYCLTARDQGVSFYLPEDYPRDSLILFTYTVISGIFPAPKGINSFLATHVNPGFMDNGHEQR